MSDRPEWTKCLNPDCGALNRRSVGLRVPCWKCWEMCGDSLPNWTGYAPNVGTVADLPAGVTIYSLEDDGDWKDHDTRGGAYSEEVTVMRVDGRYIIVSDEDEEPILGILLVDWRRDWERENTASATAATLPAANPASTKAKSVADVATA